MAETIVTPDRRAIHHYAGCLEDFRDARIPVTERLRLLLRATTGHTAGAAKTVTLSRACICDILGSDTNSLRYAEASLVDQGIIEVAKRDYYGRGPGERYANHTYRVLPSVRGIEDSLLDKLNKVAAPAYEYVHPDRHQPRTITPKPLPNIFISNYLKAHPRFLGLFSGREARASWWTYYQRLGENARALQLVVSTLAAYLESNRGLYGNEPIGNAGALMSTVCGHFKARRFDTEVPTAMNDWLDRTCQTPPDYAASHTPLPVIFGGAA